MSDKRLVISDAFISVEALRFQVEMTDNYVQLTGELPTMAHIKKATYVVAGELY